MADLIQVGVDVNITDASRQRLEKLQNKANEISGAYKKIGAVATAAFAGAAGAITLAVKESLKFEKISTQFEVLTGSVRAATASLEELEKFSASTPFQFEEVAQAGQVLLSFGFQAKDLQSLLGQLGDVSAATGKNFKELAVIFGQVTATGKLQLDRYNQLIEAGVNLGPAIAKTIGISGTAVRKAITDGKVSADAFKKAFASLSAEGGPAFKALEKLSLTLGGRISTLQDNFSAVTRQVGQFFVPVVKTLVSAISDFLGILRNNPFLAKLSGALLAVAAVTSAVIAGFAAAKIALLAMTSAAIKAKLATFGLTLSFRALAGATGIGLLVVALGIVATNFEATVNIISAVWSAFVNNFTKLIGGVGKLLLGVFTINVGLIKDGLSQAKDAVVKAASDISNDPAFQKGKKDISDAFSGGDSAELKTKLDANSQALLDAAKTDAQLIQELRLADVAAQNEEQKKFLDDKRKSNETVAKANQFFRTEEFQGTKTALGNLATLTASKNKSIAKIGQLASIGRATANTAEGFTKALAQGGIIGPILGATVLAAGAAQIATIKAQKFATGGFVGGPGFRSMDSVPTVQRVGEFNVPPESADDVINARARELAGQSGGQSIDVNININDSLFGDAIEATVTRRRALGISAI